MTHLSGADIYGEYFISHLGDEYKEASKFIFHINNKVSLNLEVSEDDQRKYRDAKWITRCGNFQRKNTVKINEFITKKLENPDEPSDDAESSFVSATGSDDDDSGSESEGTLGGESPTEDPPEDPLPFLPEDPEEEPGEGGNDHDDGNEDEDGDEDEEEMARVHAIEHRPAPAGPGTDICGYPVQETGGEPKGNELSLIPDYKGDGTADAEIWIRRVVTVAGTYNWKRSRWQYAASTRLSGDALRWLEAKSRNLEFPYEHKHTIEQGKCHEKPIPDTNPVEYYDEPRIEGKDSWVTFREAFFLRFKPITDASAAVKAVQDLKQGADESVHAFFDRVSIAVDRKNYRVADKTTADYKESRDVDHYSFFAAGIRPEIKKMTLGSPHARTDLGLFLGDCINAELVLGLHKSVQEVQVNEVKENGEGASEEKEADLTVAELKKEIDALRSNMKCFRCGEYGHIRRECKKTIKDAPNNSNNNNINRAPFNNRRGRGGRRGGGNRQNQQRRPGQQGGRGRGQGGFQNQQGYQKGNWVRANRSWMPQANFGQAGNYYQSHMINQQNPFMPVPYGPAMSTGSGGSQNSSSISAEQPWILAGNE